jgi:hypothetical protein
MDKCHFLYVCTAVPELRSGYEQHNTEKYEISCSWKMSLRGFPHEDFTIRYSERVCIEIQVLSGLLAVATPKS